MKRVNFKRLNIDNPTRKSHNATRSTTMTYGLTGATATHSTVDGFKPVREAGKPKPLSPPLAGRQAHTNITTDPASVAPMHSDEARECEKTRL